MKTHQEMIDFCEAEQREAKRLVSYHTADNFQDGKRQAFIVMLDFLKEDEAPVIEPISHIKPTPHQEFEETFEGMVEKFNKMIDVFNEQMVPKEKVEVPSDGCSVCTVGLTLYTTAFAYMEHKGYVGKICTACQTYHCDGWMFKLK